MFFSVGHAILIETDCLRTDRPVWELYMQEETDMFILLAGGLLIIIIAVIVAVVSSVVSAVAAETDTPE